MCISLQKKIVSFSALHIAARNKQNFALKTMLSVLCECSSEVERQRILNAPNVRGQTALHCAVRAGDPDCVHYLISAGAKRNVVDNNLDTVRSIYSLNFCLLKI